MPKKGLKFVQHKHYDQPIASSGSNAKLVEQRKPLLFVHRDSNTVHVKPSATESEKIRRHLAQRYGKKRTLQKHVEIHPSVNRILRRPSREDDQIVETKAEGGRSEDEVSTSSWISTQTSAFLSPSRSLTKAVLTNSLDDGILDPFTQLQETSADTRRLLFFYFKHLRPLARTVSPDWDWVDNVAEIQTSSMLIHAISAYSSAFLLGIKQGARELALPPMPEKNKAPLWMIPCWFRLQAKALSLLNQALLAPATSMKNETYHTITFLFRLAVLFGDGVAAKMHFNALQRITQFQGRQAETLSHEFVVTKINFITLYLYKESMVKKMSQRLTEEHPGYAIEPDRPRWTDENEWNKFQAMLFGRHMTWLSGAPSAVVREEARLAILRLDSKSMQFTEDVFSGLVKHYQIATYLWTYLTNIVFDPTLPKIRLHVEELVRYIRQQEFLHLEQTTPKVVFILLFAGAYASRGCLRRPWFIERLTQTHVQVKYMHDIHNELDGFCDPIHCMPVVLEEILIEIRKIRDGDMVVNKRELYQNGFELPRRGSNPLSHSPDLKTPIRVFQPAGPEEPAIIGRNALYRSKTAKDLCKPLTLTRSYNR